MGKFFVYVISLQDLHVKRVWTDNNGVRDILCNSQPLSCRILRSITNQYAMLVDEHVVWVDIPEVSELSQTPVIELTQSQYLNQ